MRRVTARYTWDRLRVSFWFIPAVMAAAAVLLAWLMYWIDSRIPNAALESSRFILAGTVGELRSSLLGVAGTVLATAGMVFTLLTLPLSTVAAQYGSRLLRLFLSDRTAQFVLGMFSATFVYCIAAALSIPPVEVEPESPQLTATLGLYLMLATFATLILLVQHISIMLQAPSIAAAAGAELLDGISVDVVEEVRSSQNQSQANQDAWISMAAADGYGVRVLSTGYIQSIDPAIILTAARDKNLAVRLLRKPGAFVARGEVVALVWPAARVDRRLDKQIRRAIRTGSQRTPTQDIECAVNQLVEMAVRAMSPAINDPFTAMTCLDYLGQGLALFARQGAESASTYDQTGQLRLIFEPVTFEELLNAAFDMLRHASCDNASVLLHMLQTIDEIGEETNSREAHQELVRHVRLIQAESLAGSLIEEDRQSVQKKCETLQTALMAVS